jgi:RNA polymerase sigma-70 factor, ECF subfamily
MSQPAPSESTESTRDLLSRFRNGEAQAADLLFQRYLIVMRRWARGRLPRYARDLADTEDIVQEALTRAFRHLGTFEDKGVGAFQAFLREIVNNRIRDEIRRALRRPGHDELSSGRASAGASPLEEAIGAERTERYEAALSRLRPIDRQAIVGRIELQQSFEELAMALGKPTANAARAATLRAIEHLVEEMDHV